MTVGPDPQLLQDVADRFGLPAEAASVLHGQSIEQLEQSAAELARIVAASRPAEPEPESELAGALAAAAAAKAQRRSQLIGALHGGQAQQPRDAAGRYAPTERPAATMDSGARPRVPESVSPEEEHRRTLVAALRDGRASAGARL
jgi:hypothetical protein